MKEHSKISKHDISNVSLNFKYYFFGIDRYFEISGNECYTFILQTKIIEAKNIAYLTKKYIFSIFGKTDLNNENRRISIIVRQCKLF